MKEVGIIIQARTGSTRLPRKVIAKIEKRPLIWHVINRVKKVKGVKIILATTIRQEDKILLKIAKDSKILSFAGDADDVLKRYYDCAVLYNCDPIIRITADCPLIDPNVIQKMLKIFQSHTYDYVTNTLPSSFPDGLDTEIFSFKTLQEAYEKAKMNSEREHVTPYIRKNKKKFKIFNYINSTDLSHNRWVVDQIEDLKLVRKIYAKMRPNLTFGFQDTLKIILKNPKMVHINSGIKRNEGYLRSLKNDSIKK